MRSVSADGGAVGLGFQFAEGVEVIFERSDTAYARFEVGSSGAVAGTDFEEMITEICARENPREEPASGDIAPERGRAKEMFGGVHG